MNSEAIVNKVKDYTPSILGDEEFSKYAVLLPLIQKENDIHILFEVRSHKLRRQPGEICFPGGRIDKQDQSVQAAAIRETREELGISNDQISNVSALDYLVSPFGMIVYPHMAFINHHESIVPNHAEVEEVFSVPLSFFLETKPAIYHVNVSVKPEENFPFDLIIGGKDYQWRSGKVDEYFYVYEDKVIWGLTARFLARFVELIK